MNGRQLIPSTRIPPSTWNITGIGRSERFVDLLPSVEQRTSPTRQAQSPANASSAVQVTRDERWRPQYGIKFARPAAFSPNASPKRIQARAASSQTCASPPQYINHQTSLNSAAVEVRDQQEMGEKVERLVEKDAPAVSFVDAEEAMDLWSEREIALELKVSEVEDHNKRLQTIVAENERVISGLHAEVDRLNTELWRLRNRSVNILAPSTSYQAPTSARAYSTQSVANHSSTVAPMVYDPRGYSSHFNSPKRPSQSITSHEDEEQAGDHVDEAPSAQLAALYLAPANADVADCSEGQDFSCSEVDSLFDASRSSENESDGSGGDDANTDSAPTMTFEIPDDVLQKAKEAEPSTADSFWSYTLYKNPDGKSITRHYVTKYDKAEQVAAEFMDEKVLGFDLEWEQYTVAGKHDPKRCVSLLQIACEDRIALFHLAVFKDRSADELIPPSLRKILTSDQITKTGVNIAGDSMRMQKCFGIEMKGNFELSHLYKVIAFGQDEPNKVNKRIVRLAFLTEEYLGLPMYKGEVRTSMWSSRLEYDQITYAASDAYAGFRIFHALEVQRLAMDPVPPRPAFWELDEPLRLGNGKVLRKVPTAKAVAAENEDGEDADADTFFEALEEQREDSNETAYDTANTSTKATAAKKEKLKTEVPQSAELATANAWVENWRQDKPETSRKIPSDAQLRAYHLWHEQGFDLKTTAAFLRRPPLALQTVATYVIESIDRSTPQLPYEIVKLEEAFEVMPQASLYRYWKLRAQLQS